jgi:mono/diheme cytochrome c family protein
MQRQKTPVTVWLGLFCIDTAAAVLATAMTLVVTPASSEKTLAAAERRGLAFAQANCARCHAIGRSGASPFAPAPPFRTLHLRYPIEDLEEPLAEGIVTGHPAMPEFRLDPGQVGDIIAYLKSLSR